MIQSCITCGRRDHPAQLCPNMPADVAARLQGTGEHETFSLEWGDTVALYIPNDADEQAIFIGVNDADEETTATVSLNPDEAARLGAELTLAALVKRGQQ